MKKYIILFSIFLAFSPVCSHGKSLHIVGGRISFTLQKKHSPVVDKVVELFTADMKSNYQKGEGKSGSANVMLYQLDMASNKEMKALGSLRVPVLDFITKRDAFWIGVRKGKVVIVGSNGRGTAYGLMQLCSMKDGIDEKYETTQVPSVEFRGVSIENAKLSSGDCRKLFRIMLHKRANVLCAEWDEGETKLHVTKNLRIVADSFGIDLATPQYGNAIRLHGHKRDAVTIDVPWHDDGYGYIMKTGDAGDNAGAVYHLNFAGEPHDYLWLAASQPGLISNEMLTAYSNGAKRLWLVVVRDPDIAAYPLDLFLDLAWDVDTLMAGGVQGHLSSWIAKKFGGDVATRLVSVLRDYYRLAGICRPEFMDKAEFNAEEFGNELERYLNDYRDICNKVKGIGELVGKPHKDQYFMNVEYPVCGSALMADKTLEAQESRLIGRKPSFHHDDEALESAARSMKAHWALMSLTDRYDSIAEKQYWNKPVDDGLQGTPVFRTPKLTDTVSVSEVEKYYNAEPVYAPLSNDGCIVRNAYGYTTASDDARQIDMLGHSMKAVELKKEGVLTYRFRSDGVGGVLRLAFIPAFSPDGSSSQCSVSIDGGSPTTIIVNDGSASSMRWRKGVLRGQSLVTLPVSLPPGMHTLTIKALNDHVVFDQWMIDRDTDRQFYVFPIAR